MRDVKTTQGCDAKEVIILIKIEILVKVIELNSFPFILIKNLKEVDHFKYFGIVLRRLGYCTN